MDNTNVTIDNTKDPFKDHGPTIVGNFVPYSSSLDEEEVKEVKEKK